MQQKPVLRMLYTSTQQNLLIISTSIQIILKQYATSFLLLQTLANIPLHCSREQQSYSFTRNVKASYNLGRSLSISASGILISLEMKLQMLKPRQLFFTFLTPLQLYPLLLPNIGPKHIYTLNSKNSSQTMLLNDTIY